MQILFALAFSLTSDVSPVQYLSNYGALLNKRVALPAAFTLMKHQPSRSYALTTSAETE